MRLTATKNPGTRNGILLAAAAAVVVLCVSVYLFVSHEPAVEEAPDWLEIERVRTGNTVILKHGEKLVYRGAQAPTEGQSLFDEARKRNEALLKDQKVRVRYEHDSERDKKDRLLGYVFVNKKLINAELIREGLAYARITSDMTRFNKELLAAASEARNARRGIWAQPAPTIDSEYWADPKHGLFHRVSCAEKSKAKAERIQTTKSRDDSFARGWAPCEDCNP